MTHPNVPAFGSTVEFIPGFPLTNSPIRALVIDRDGDDLILELNMDPDPPEYDENVMLWPIKDSDMLKEIS